MWCAGNNILENRLNRIFLLKSSVEVFKSKNIN